MSENLLQHYGVDWIAMALTFFAIYSLGNKKRYGFCVMMAGNACWIALALKFQSLGMIVANAGFFAMNFRGFVRWGRESHKDNQYT